MLLKKFILISCFIGLALSLLVLISGIALGKTGWFMEEYLEPSGLLLPMTPHPGDTLCPPKDYKVKTFNYKKWRRKSAKRLGGGWQMVFDDSEAVNLTRLDGTTFQTQPQTTSELNFILYNGQAQPDYDVRFYTVINSELTQMIEGSSHPMYHETSIPYQDHARLKLNIPPLAEGVYHISVLFIEEPGSLTHLMPMTMDDSMAFSLVVGNPSMESLPRYERLISSTQRGNTVYGYNSLPMGGAYIAPATWQADPFYANWDYMEMTAQPGEAVTLYTNLGYSAINREKELPLMQQFSLGVILDDQQIEVKTDTIDTPGKTLKGEVARSTGYTHIPVYMIAPEEPGVYEVLIVRTPNVNIPDCILSGGMGGHLLDHFTRFMRLSLTVQ